MSRGVRKSSVIQSFQKQNKHITLLLRVVLIFFGILFVLGISIGAYYIAKPNTSTMNKDMISCNTNDDCELEDKNYQDTSYVCCPDLSSSNIVAFNANWYDQYKNAHPVTRTCTMMCMRPNYKAQCINHICQKVHISY